MRKIVGGPEDGAGPPLSRASRSSYPEPGSGLHGRRRPQGPGDDQRSYCLGNPSENHDVEDVVQRARDATPDHSLERQEPVDAANGDATLDKFWHRAGWLVMLLGFQSCSSFILERFELLIKSHPVIIYFLTMLVGAGGNVGGQSVVLVIRRLALAKLPASSRTQELSESTGRLVCNEFSIGCRLAFVLLVASAARCEAFEVRGMECLAICLSMIAIVITSAVLGVTLPLLFQKLKLDPAHAGATVQVLMDGIGVTLTCFISCFVLGVPLSGPLPAEHATQAPDHRWRSIQNAGSRHGLNMFGQ